MMVLAYANGVICFARRTKPGTLPITSGPAKQLRAAVSGLARRAYDGKTLLVPGLPEACSWNERSAAIVRFQARIEESLGRPALARKITRFERRVATRRAS